MGWAMRRVIRTIIFVVVLLVGIPLAVVAAFVAWGMQDIAPCDDSDLQLTRLEVPEEENAFPVVLKAGEAMFVPRWNMHPASQPTNGGPIGRPPGAIGESDFLGAFGVGEGVGYWEAILEIACGRRSNDALAEEALRRNGQALDLFDQALARPYLQFPSSVYDPEFVSPFLSHSSTLVRLALLRARMTLADGDPQQAVEQVVKILRFGRSVRNAQGTVMCYYVGLAIGDRATGALRAWTGDSRVTCEILSPYMVRLEDMRPGSDGLADAIRGQYRWQLNGLDLEIDRVLRRSDECRFVPAAFRYHPNETRKMLTDMCRDYVRYVTGSGRRPAPTFEPFNPFKDGRLPRALQPNSLGTEMFGYLGYSIDSIVVSKARSANEISAAQACIALRCYFDRTGRLPETLDELVPEYLHGVPVDEFDGMPLRYDRERGVLYSVDRDLVDSGGVEGSDDRSWVIELPGLEGGKKAAAPSTRDTRRGRSR